MRVNLDRYLFAFFVDYLLQTIILLKYIQIDQFFIYFFSSYLNINIISRRVGWLIRSDRDFDRIGYGS